MAQEYVQIAMTGTIAAGGAGAKNVVNLYHFRRSSTINNINKTNISDAFQTAIGDAVLDALQADYQQTANVVRFFDDALDFAAPQTQSGVGAVATARSPDFVAAVVRYKANINSRSGRGSNHYGPIAEADTDGDTCQAGLFTKLQTIGNAVQNGFTDADGNVWLPVIKSSKFGAQYAVNPVTVVTFPIVQFIANLTLGTMRRRKARA